MSVSILYLLQILVSAFLAILFLQSGIDKIVDRRGNLEWLKGHFAKSPLGGFVPLLFAALTIIEVAAGVLSGIGFLALILAHNPAIAFYCAVVSAVAIIALFFGQRMAKENAGAAILIQFFFFKRGVSGPDSKHLQRLLARNRLLGMPTFCGFAFDTFARDCRVKFNHRFAALDRCIGSTANDRTRFQKTLPRVGAGESIHPKPRLGKK